MLQLNNLLLPHLIILAFQVSKLVCIVAQPVVQPMHIPSSGEPTQRFWNAVDLLWGWDDIRLYQPVSTGFTWFHSVKSTN